MAWTTPKTDWFAGTNPDNYNGDRFTYVDFNRIKNNIDYLYEKVIIYFDVEDVIKRREEISQAFIDNDFRSGTEDYFLLKDGKQNRTPADFIYADEINYFEYKLDYLNEIMEWLVPGTRKTFYPNDVFIDATELNRLETICAVCKDYFTNLEEARRTLAFSLSQEENHIDL